MDGFRPVRLSEIVQNLQHPSVPQLPEIAVSGICLDSRQVSRGCIFVAVEGAIRMVTVSFLMRFSAGGGYRGAPVAGRPASPYIQVRIVAVLWRISLQLFMGSQADH
jgi:hypothetical protein